MDTDKWSIDKLGPENWTTWKFQMRHYLLSKGLWKYVDGTEELPEDAGEATRATFCEKSQKALSTIVMAISTPHIYLVTSCEKPKEVWDTLRSHFERETLANKLYLKKQYFHKQMSEGTSIEKHLKEMKEVTDKLASIGAPISKEDQVVTLLGSLPSSYSTLVTALEARVDELKLDFVQQALIHEEQKQVGASSSHSLDSALVGGNRPRKPPVCWGCGETGHIKRYCPKNKYTGENKTAEKSNKASTIVSAEETSHQTSPIESEEEPESAFTGLNSGCTMDCSWIIDSGATSHMTFQKELLRNYKEFSTPEKIGFGDGRVVNALGSGSI